MKKVFLCAATLLLAIGAYSQTILILTQDEEVWHARTGTDNDFTVTDDCDPNSLVMLSTGSFVFFESEGTANPGGSAPETGFNNGDFVVLFDPDDPGGGLDRFEVLLPEEGTPSLNSAIGASGSQDIRISDIVVNSSDDLYLGVSDASGSAPYPHYIVKLPSTGADSYGNPILVADDTRVGTSQLASQIDLAIKETGSDDIIYFTVDDEGDDSEAANDDNLFIYSISGSATNDEAPVALANSSFSELMTTLGGTGGTDKTDVDNICYVPSTDQLLVGNGGNTDADVARGDIAAYDLATNAYSAWLDASTLPGTPTSSVITYNADDDVVALFWHIGASSASPEQNDRVDEFQTDGTFIATVGTEDDIQAVDGEIGDLVQYGSAFEYSGGNYFLFHGGNPESIVEIIPSTSVGDWMMF